MTRDDIHKLIGGYATGSLSEAERKALFEAALDDQDLFDELAREQALKELLDEPGAKQRLIAGLAPQPERTWWRQPWPWLAVAGAVALAIVIANVMLLQPPEKQDIAQARIPELRSAPVEPAAREATTSKATAPNAPVRQDAPVAPKPVLREELTLKDELALKKVAPPAELRKEATPPAQDAIAAAKDTAPANVVEADKREAAAAAPAAAPPPPAIRAAAPAAPPPAPNAFTGGVAGFGGGGGGRAQQLQQSQGLTSAKVAPSPRFSFSYSVTAEGNLRIQPISDGFLTVIVSKTAANQGQVLLSSQPTKAGSSVDVPVPAGSTQATIVYTAQSIPAGTVTGSLAAQDPASGTKADPAPSPNSRLQAVIPLTPRE